MGVEPTKNRLTTLARFAASTAPPGNASLPVEVLWLLVGFRGPRERATAERALHASQKPGAQSALGVFVEPRLRDGTGPVDGSVAGTRPRHRPKPPTRRAASLVAEENRRILWYRVCSSPLGAGADVPPMMRLATSPENFPLTASREYSSSRSAATAICNAWCCRSTASSRGRLTKCCDGSQ